METQTKEGKYIYCIIRPGQACGGAAAKASGRHNDQGLSFGPLGIGERGDEVHTVRSGDIAAVVSDSPVKSYAVSRENLLAHEKAIEAVMKEHTVLPVRFCKRYGVKKIVTHCPHCFHVLKNEYPRFGGEYEVFHHTEFVQRLIQEEKIHLSKGMSGVVTYHDSCYLGRYNNIYETPRKLLQAIPELKVEEMEQVRSGSFCCGAGGGHLWMDETSGKRISHLRLEQAMRTSAETLAVACPYCLQMLEDATRSLESPLQVRDLIELVADSVT
ncbi:MAG: GvpL/GvpF family gas vesicle protein [bacterium]